MIAFPPLPHSPPVAGHLLELEQRLFHAPFYPLAFSTAFTHSKRSRNVLI